MEFECKTIPIMQPILTGKGVQEPLCNKCSQTDCSNPIRKKTISLFGKNVEWNVFIAGNQAYQVIACPGYQE